MSNFLRGISVNAALTLILGLILAIMPGVAADALVSVLGWILIVFGAVCLISALALRSGREGAGPIAGGLLALASGLALLLRPGVLVSLGGLVLGLLLVIHGLQDFSQARKAKAMGYDAKPAMIVAVVKLVLGALILINPFSTVALLIRIAGIFLILDALGDLLLVRNAAK